MRNFFVNETCSKNCLKNLLTLRHFYCSSRDVDDTEETESAIADEGEPIEVTTELRDQDACQGDPVCFELRATGNPMPSAIWYIKDKMVVESPRIAIKTDTEAGVYSLTIDPVEVKDEGEIKCMLRNNSGRAAVTAELFVMGKSFFASTSLILYSDISMPIYRTFII